MILANIIGPAKRFVVQGMLHFLCCILRKFPTIKTEHFSIQPNSAKTFYHCPSAQLVTRHQGLKHQGAGSSGEDSIIVGTRGNKVSRTNWYHRQSFQSSSAFDQFLTHLILAIAYGCDPAPNTITTMMIPAAKLLRMPHRNLISRFWGHQWPSNLSQSHCGGLAHRSPNHTRQKGRRR